MEEIDESEKLRVSEWHTLMRIVLSTGGFLLSIVFILSGMFMMVRFWLITDFIYLLYMISTILVGILFTIFSSNLFLYTEKMTNKTIWPYVWLTPITIFWTTCGIVLPYFQVGYFNRYSHIPVLTYSQAFYDSDAFNENQDHPFASAYKHNSVFFNNQGAVIAVLIILLVIQVLFWMTAIGAYLPICREYFGSRKAVKELFTHNSSTKTSHNVNCQRPYHVENTSSRPITEVKQRRA